MIEVIISCLICILTFLFGINYGRKEKELEYKTKQIKSIKKSTNIDCTPDDTIISMYDKYE